MLNDLLFLIIPPITDILELMGVIILIIAGIKAFYYYILCLFHRCNLNFKHDFANSMATALEFKLAAEILNTVIVHTISEIAILGAIILLRAIMSIIIHIEMKS